MLACCKDDDFGFSWLVLEQIPEKTLHHLLQEIGKPELKFCLNVLLDLSLAGDFLHRYCLTHNFINSQSVYYFPNEHVKLGNFEYSQEADNIAPINDIEEQLPWMAPVQIKGELPDIFSDVYRYVILSDLMITSGRKVRKTTQKRKKNARNICRQIAGVDRLKV